MKSYDKSFTNHYQEQLGNRLRNLRKEKGYNSAERFAYEHGFNRVQIGRYEGGANISWATLVKIIDALGMTIPEFFSEGFDQAPDA